MEKFEQLMGVAAPFPLMNVDTDMIIPKQFLKTIRRTGLGKSLFFDMRYIGDGGETADFVLNRPAFRNAKILIVGSNFGCGSSREHAPWALLDFGIRCVIAPSFADIFFNNCFMNGILPVVLPTAEVDRLMAIAEGHPGSSLTVDLPRQQIRTPDGASVRFDIDPFRKECLLGGLDDIGLTMQKSASIDAFEAQQRVAAPWLY